MGVTGSHCRDIRPAPSIGPNASNQLCLLLSIPSPASESVWKCIGLSGFLRGKLCLVCRNFREAGYQKVVTIDDNRAPISAEFLHSILKDAPHLQSLTIRRKSHDLRVSQKLLLTKLSVGSNSLRFLDLSNQSLTDFRFLEKMPLLEHLILKNCRVPKEHIQTNLSMTLNSLRYLDLSNQKVADLRFLEKMPHLNHLLLKNVQLKDTNGFCRMICSEQIYQDITPIGFLESLTVLFLSCPHYVDLTPLSRCQCLKKLFIAPATKIYDISALARCKSLRTLAIFGANSIENFDVISYLHQLRILILFSAHQLTRLDWIINCKWLHTFILVRATLTCDASSLASLPDLRLLLLRDAGIYNISALHNSASLQMVSIAPLVQTELISSFNHLMLRRPDICLVTLPLELKVETHFINDNDIVFLTGSGTLTFTSS